jgi:hypothetical protein
MDDDTTRAVQGMFVAVLVGAALWMIAYAWLA